FYTNFTGFDIQEFQHLSYYVFLVKTKRAVISIKNQGHNLNLKQYRQMLAKYEKYREHEFLSEDHLTEILIARQSQMNILIYTKHTFLSEDHLTELLIARQSQMNFLL